jgi:hypothetical protein
MIAAAVCELPSGLNIEFLQRKAGWTTELHHESQGDVPCLK